MKSEGSRRQHSAQGLHWKGALEILDSTSDNICGNELTPVAPPPAPVRTSSPLELCAKSESISPDDARVGIPEDETQMRTELEGRQAGRRQEMPAGAQ